MTCLRVQWNTQLHTCQRFPASHVDDLQHISIAPLLCSQRVLRHHDCHKPSLPAANNSLHYTNTQHRLVILIHLWNYINVSSISPVSAVSTRRHLRSAGQGDLVVPQTRTAGFGPRSFSVAGPLAWNSLPLEMKTSLTLRQFSSRLKTEMFLRSYYSSVQPS